MPVQRTQSGLLAKLGNRLVQAHEKHKNDTTELSNFGDLPAGVEGVARLVECKFAQIAQGKQNAGQYMFYAAGIVVEPEFHEGLKVAGRRTQISEPFFDTPQSMGARKTFDDHLDHIYTHLRALGLSTADLDPDSLEETVAALKDMAPYFRFRTWKGKKQTTGPYKDQDPKVQHSWMGKCDFTEDVEPGEGVQDDSVANDTEESYSPPTPANGHVKVKAKGKAVTNGPAASLPPAVAKRTKAGPPPADLEFGDITSLVKKAKKGNEDARQELNDMAMAAGATEEEVLEAEDWDAVAALITAGKAAVDEPVEDETEEVDKDEEEGGGTQSEEGDEGDDEEESTLMPQVGQVVLYRPLDKKTGRPAKKPIDCEVVAVDGKGQTVTLKSLDDGKTLYKLVAWTSIEPQE